MFIINIKGISPQQGIATWSMPSCRPKWIMVLTCNGKPNVISHRNISWYFNLSWFVYCVGLCISHKYKSILLENKSWYKIVFMEKCSNTYLMSVLLSCLTNHNLTISVKYWCHILCVQSNFPVFCFRTKHQTCPVMRNAIQHQRQSSSTPQNSFNGFLPIRICIKNLLLVKLLIKSDIIIMNISNLFNTIPIYL